MWQKISSQNHLCRESIGFSKLNPMVFLITIEWGEYQKPCQPFLIGRSKPVIFIRLKKLKSTRQRHEGSLLPEDPIGELQFLLNLQGNRVKPRVGSKTRSAFIFYHTPDDNQIFIIYIHKRKTNQKNYIFIFLILILSSSVYHYANARLTLTV